MWRRRCSSTAMAIDRYLCCVGRSSQVVRARRAYIYSQGEGGGRADVRRQMWQGTIGGVANEVLGWQDAPYLWWMTGFLAGLHVDVDVVPTEIDRE